MRIKYPRIPHIVGSHPGSGDLVLKRSLSSDTEWIVTEKVDGSQICFTVDDGIIRAFNRNSELLKGRSDRQFDILQEWLNPHYDAMVRFMKERYIIYGEWMFHTHTIYYDQLPDWFIGFGIRDKLSFEFIPFYETIGNLSGIGLSTASIITKTQIKSLNQIESYIRKSFFSSTELMEGVVLHSIDDNLTCKYVTAEFMDSVDNSRHWRKCDRTLNKLNKG